MEETEPQVEDNSDDIPEDQLAADGDSVADGIEEDEIEDES